MGKNFKEKTLRLTKRVQFLEDYLLRVMADRDTALLSNDRKERLILSQNDIIRDLCKVITKLDPAFKFRSVFKPKTLEPVPFKLNQDTHPDRSQ